MGRDRARTAEMQAVHRRRNFAELIEFLASHPCTDCGESDPVVLDFDHLPGEVKRFNVVVR